jgi:hypothetical protein
MLGESLWFLYRVAFPSLDGGHQSLIYFREIARTTETNFIDAFTAQDEGLRVKDPLGQVWRFQRIEFRRENAGIAQHPSVHTLITK